MGEMCKSAESKIKEMLDEISELKVKILELESYSARMVREKIDAEREMDQWKAKYVMAIRTQHEDLSVVGDDQTS